MSMATRDGRARPQDRHPAASSRCVSAIRVGRVRWLHAEIDEPMPDPVTCALFTLRPDRPDRPDVKIAAANDNQTAEERDAEIQDT